MNKIAPNSLSPTNLTGSENYSSIDDSPLPDNSNDDLVPSIFKNLTGSENYSSIDDSPLPDNSNDDLVPSIFKKLNEQYLQKSLQFHLGTSVTSPVRAQSPQNIVPTLSPNENVDNVYHQEQLDQLVPDISGSESYVVPDNEFISPNLYDDELHNFQGNELFPRPKLQNNNIPFEWLSTKLTSDQSEAINKALLCFSQCCYDKICKKGKGLLEDLKKNIQQLKVIDCNGRKVLEFLLEHHKNCDEPQCIAPGCNQAINSLEKLIDCITKESNLLHYSEKANFFQFSNDCCVKCPQDVKRTAIYTIISQSSIIIYHNNHSWSKITVIYEIMQDVLPLLKEIGHLRNHQNILPIHWLIDDGNISYSTEHYAEPLRYKFNMLNMDKKDIILQLIKAALYLNANKIAFLAWTSENVYYKDGRVMLTNFHMGSALFDDFDSGLIKQLVFPTILPPELDSNDESLEKADVWGVCCLLYELLNHKVVHSDLLHMQRENVWRMLNKNGWRPKYTCSDERLQNIFNSGWKVQPEDRIELCKLKDKISNYRKDFE